MRPEYTLVLCLVGLGLGVAYAWWIAIRPTLYQADLQAIRAKLDSAMRAEGKTADFHYLLLRGMIDVLIARAAYLSIPVMFLSQYWQGGIRAEPNPPGPIRNVEDAVRFMEGQGLHPAVEWAKNELLVRSLIHVALSPGNYLALLLLLALGKTKEFASLVSSLWRIFRAIDPPLPTPTHAA